MKNNETKIELSSLVIRGIKKFVFKSLLPRRKVVKRLKFNHILRILGPGLITGAADDDPSGIATYSQTGAQFGFGMLWTALYQIPLLIAIQEACARIGAVTGKGIAGVIKDNYSRKVLYVAVLFVVAANIINVGADIGAVADSAQLVVNVPFVVLAILTTAIVTLLIIFVPYKKYAKILKWLAFALLSYPITAFLVHEPWGKIIHATLIPHISFSFSFLFLITGVFGTTISPYMFFWQSSGEVEEEVAAHMVAQRGGIPRLTKKFMRNLKIDNSLGMLSAEIAQWFIIITTATVLFSHGIHNINTAAQAASALQPLVRSFPNSGQLAKDIFAAGVIGLGLLAIPILAGSASYAMSEAFGWKEGLYYRFRKAKAFYIVIIIATLIGLLINFLGINPIKALVFTAVFNGVAAVPLIYLIARINSNKNIMGDYRGGLMSRVFIWLTFAIMATAAVAMFITLAYPNA